MQHCHTATSCSSAPTSETTSTDTKVLQISSGPSPCLRGTSSPRHIELHHLLGCRQHWDTRLGYPYPCTGWMTVLLVRKRRRTVSLEPGMQWGNFKRVLKTASGLIKIVLLSYYSHNPAPDLRRFIISSSHPKWIWWVILRNRKRLWPIFRPSASASKTRKKCYNISVLFF